MPELIPVDLIVGWIQDLRADLRARASECVIRGRMLDHVGFEFDRLKSMIKTWQEHQENLASLAGSGKQFLIVYDAVVSDDGRLKKLKWYEGNQFITLAWRHGIKEEVGELALELEKTNDLSRACLVYGGASTYDDLAQRVRQGGLEAIRNDLKDFQSEAVQSPTEECSTSAVSGTAINDSEVGIFYIVDGRIVSEKIPVSEIEPLGGVHSIPVEHSELWSELQDKNPNLHDMTWWDLPRGRVVYNGNKDRFEIFADQHILEDERLISELVADYRLENRDVHASGDEMYRCADCVRT